MAEGHNWLAAILWILGGLVVFQRGVDQSLKTTLKGVPSVQNQVMMTESSFPLLVKNIFVPDEPISTEKEFSGSLLKIGILLRGESDFRSGQEKRISRNQQHVIKTDNLLWTINRLWGEIAQRLQFLKNDASLGNSSGGFTYVLYADGKNNSAFVLNFPFLKSVELGIPDHPSPFGTPRRVQLVIDSPSHQKSEYRQSKSGPCHRFVYPISYWLLAVFLFSLGLFFAWPLANLFRSVEPTWFAWGLRLFGTIFGVAPLLSLLFGWGV